MGKTQGSKQAGKCPLLPCWTADSWLAALRLGSCLLAAGLAVSAGLALSLVSAGFGVCLVVGNALVDKLLDILENWLPTMTRRTQPRGVLR